MTVAAILGQLAAGRTTDEILHDHPYLGRDDIRTAVEFAAVAADPELHELVDRLAPERADDPPALVRHLVAASEQEPLARGARNEGRVRRLWFAGTLRTGRDDLAARSEEFIRDHRPPPPW